MAQTEKRSSGSGWRLATFFLIGAVICSFISISRLQDEVIESQAGLEAAYNDGYSEGYEDGCEDTEPTAYDNGYDDGYAKGSDESFDSGYDDGYNCGYLAGFSDGRCDWIDELSFFRNGACIVTQSGSRYHRYNCPHIKDRSFWIYNIELAEYKGYSPCLDCWVDDPLSVFPSD